MNDSDVERRFVFHGKRLPDSKALTDIIVAGGFEPRPVPISPSNNVFNTGVSTAVTFVHNDGSRIEHLRTQSKNFGTDKYQAFGSGETVDCVMSRIEQTYAEVQKYSKS